MGYAVFFRLILVLFASYSVVLSILNALTFTVSTDIYLVSYLALITTAFTLSALDLGKMEMKPKLKSRASMRHLAFGALGLIVILALVWRFRLLPLKGLTLWMDEEYQFYPIIAWVKQSHIVASAASQQQPPLDYIFSWGAKYFLGEMEWVVRLHANIFGGLSVWLFFHLLRAFKVDSFLAASATFVFLFHPVLAWYNVEARPISLSAFSFILYLYFFWEFLNNPRANAKSLLASGLLLQMATGLQPIVAVCALAIAVTPIWFTKNKDRVLKVWLITSTSLLLSTPIFYQIYTLSKKWNQFYEESYYSLIFEALSNFGWIEIRSYLDIFEQYQFLIAALIGLLGVGAWLSLKKKSEQRLLVISIVGCLFFMGFALLFESVYAVINWELHARYYILIVPGLLFFIFVALQEAANIRGTFGHRLTKFFSILIVLTGCLTGYEKSFANYANKKRATMIPWKSIYSLIQIKSQNAVMFNVPVLTANIGLYGNVMDRIYNSNPDQVSVESTIYTQRLEGKRHFKLVRIPKDRLEQLTDTYIYVSMRSTEFTSRLIHAANSVGFVEFFRHNLALVFRKPNDSAPSKSLHEFMSQVANDLGTAPEAFFLHESLAQFQLANQQWSEANSSLKFAQKSLERTEFGQEQHLLVRSLNHWLKISWEKIPDILRTSKNLMNATEPNLSKKSF